MTATNLIRKYEDLFDPAFRRAAQETGEEVGWALGILAMPSGESDSSTGEEQLITVLTIYVSIPGAEKATLVRSTTLTGMDGLDPDDAVGMAKRMVDDLVNARTGQKAQRAVDEAAAITAGRQPPMGGVLTPDGAVDASNNASDDQSSVDSFVRGE